ncbi:hypothetical protein QFZ77_002961 [Paenibacillus sp. V4I3]|nr:hypothetical protein [Paenibacillus sp. V4I3]
MIFSMYFKIISYLRGFKHNAVADMDRQPRCANGQINLIDRNNQQGIFHEINEYSSYSFLKIILRLNEYL